MFEKQGLTETACACGNIFIFLRKAEVPLAGPQESTL
jgi:hypothetical protein